MLKKITSYYFFHGLTLGLLVYFLCFISGCSLSQNTVSNTNDGEEFYLSQSLYGGKFYDHDRLRLMDNRPFKEIEELSTWDNYILLPPKEDEIIPFGTKIRIKKIQYPTPYERLKRPIYSPKHCVWVYLSVAQERGNTNFFREKTYILLVPSNIKAPQAITEYINQHFTIKDPTAWLLKQRPYIQEAILKKRPAIGMNSEQLMAALGKPLFIEKAHDNAVSQGNSLETYNYGEYTVVLEDNFVSQVTNKNITNP